MSSMSRRIRNNIREQKTGSRRAEDAKRERYHYEGGRRPLERKRTVPWLMRRDVDHSTADLTKLLRGLLPNDRSKDPKLLEALGMRRTDR